MDAHDRETLRLAIKELNDVGLPAIKQMALTTLLTFADKALDKSIRSNMPAISPADLLAKMADTYRERNAIYGDNWRNVGKVMAALFPGGVHHATEEDHNTFHLFSLIIVKLTRYANSKLSHQDSIHDVAVYAAMLEAIILEKKVG